MIYIMLKRLFDIIFSFLGLIIVSPLLVLIAIIVKLTSRGSVFYRGVRVGRKGKLFKILKFRTMIPDAERLGGSATSADDSRLTNFGKFLKRYKVDELPQLFNVLRGEMSFVGPRPEVKMYIDILAEKEKKIILSIRPGMTDLATLWDFREEDALKGSLDPEKTYADKIRPTKTKMQIDYIKNRSFLLDLKIIFKSIIRIFQ